MKTRIGGGRLRLRGRGSKPAQSIVAAVVVAEAAAVRIGASKAVLPLAGSVIGSDAVIAAADRLDLAMVFTGVRHFRQ